jgi:hypothetical protein
MAVKLSKQEEDELYLTISEKVLSGWPDEKIARKLGMKSSIQLTEGEIMELVAKIRPRAFLVADAVKRRARARIVVGIILFVLGLAGVGVGLLFTMFTDGQYIFIGLLIAGCVFTLGGLFYFVQGLMQRAKLK